MILVNLRDYTWNVPIDCVKTMQGIDQRTRSCVALNLLASTVSKKFKINLEGQTYVHFEVILSRNVKIFGIMASL